MPFSEEYAKFTQAMKFIDSLESFFTNLYKNESCLTLERDYSYFQYLLFSKTAYNPLDTYDSATLERFFLDCRIFEFLDKMFFSESLIGIYFNPILYGYTLLYKSFEIEEKFKVEHRQTALKLRKEPRFYDESIHEFVDRFLYAPVLKIAKVDFDFPGCIGDHSLLTSSTSSLLTSLLSNCNIDISNNVCECFRWKLLIDSLSKNTSIRTTIMDTLNSHITINSRIVISDVMSRYLNRNVSEPFNISEICLSKLICSVISNLNSQKYDINATSIILKLCVYSIEYPVPSYLYFAFKFSNVFEESEQLENGTGLHSGHGEKHIKDEDIAKDDINDDYNNEEDTSVKSDGIEMSNEGEFYSVSNESEGESGIDNIEDDNKDVIEEANDDNSENDRGNDEDNIDSTNNTSESSNESIDSSINDDNIDDSDNVANELVVNKLDYQWNESTLNKSQTCISADNYSKKVAGRNLNGMDQKDVLQEGEGDELVEGEDLAGKECSSVERSVVFNRKSPDCVKLTNLLKVILESNKNSKYKGDFKTGKKLNLKRIIPYIASDYRKDKIWMKRAKSDKKEYILRIFIDNSKSMNDQHLVDVLSEVYYKLDASFSLLDIPVQLYKFGTTLRECKIEDLTFDEESTLINWTDQFDDGINIILTDGIFQNVGYAKDNFLVVMIDRGNVKTMSKVSLIENRVFIEKYLDSFALKYCIIQNIDDLEKIFVEALSNIIRNLFN
ncbi:uncharacterized protein VICG_01544 [Vittaforma corneae ATCC 50505]|uniref:Uncharacterized protein n=1 Tax=Vittaforma corneae (strain ATCC 50505) TaxID=993615 RepID=L2GLB8_VITCO|nr:uncharacterized protein VICG_01544 [Vittaforma corneae ATCC 50505]ELA41439.1 hypothetical protein VICG_01544 [Vittaforma corneae ATCC 50505]